MNRYLIVTNDEMEYPVAEVIGIKQVAEYLDLSVDRVCKCMKNDTWSKRRKYKAVIDKRKIKRSDSKSYVRRYSKKYYATHNIREYKRNYQREYYRRKREVKL